MNEGSKCHQRCTDVRKPCERRPVSFAVKEMQSEPMRWYYRRTRMAKIRKADNTKCRWSPWNSCSPLVRVQPGTVILRQFGISLESETQTHIWASNPSPTHSPNEPEGRPQTFMAASLVLSRNQKQALSTGERRNKLRRAHPQRNTTRCQK